MRCIGTSASVLASVLLCGLCTGCLGVYAEVSATVLPGASYEPATESDPRVRANPVDGASAIGVNFGADFDFWRRGRFAMGYQFHQVDYGKDASGNLGVTDARADFNLWSLSRDLKLRGGLGFGFGNGGSANVPRKDGGSLDIHNANGGLASAGAGVAWYLTPRMAVHGLLSAQYLQQQVPGGTVTGVGPSAKLTFVYTFGDTRPTHEEFLPRRDKRNVMPQYARAAREAGCQGQDTFHQTYAALSLTCDDDPRPVVLVQVAEGVLVRCESREEDECAEILARVQAKLQPRGQGPVPLPDGATPSALPDPASPTAP